MALADTRRVAVPDRLLPLVDTALVADTHRRHLLVDDTPPLRPADTVAALVVTSLLLPGLTASVARRVDRPVTLITTEETVDVPRLPSAARPLRLMIILLRRRGAPVDMMRRGITRPGGATRTPLIRLRSIPALGTMIVGTRARVRPAAGLLRRRGDHRRPLGGTMITIAGGISLVDPSFFFSLSPLLENRPRPIMMWKLS